jgi:hypothetical protein
VISPEWLIVIDTDLLSNCFFEGIVSEDEVSNCVMGLILCSKGLEFLKEIDVIVILEVQATISVSSRVSESICEVSVGVRVRKLSIEIIC